MAKSEETKGSGSKGLPENAAVEAEKLRRELHKHNRLYYVENQPVISDREFDKLLKSLEKLEAEHPELKTPDSPTQRVGGEVLDQFATVAHKVPMLSIDNTYNFEEVREWETRVRKELNPGEAVRFVVELKVDGVAVTLRYEKGRLVLGATRGDGERGDDITANLKTVRNVPLNLAEGAPDLLEVRGEVYMTYAELIRLNQSRKERGEAEYANTRNTTAGSLKQLDSRNTASRRLAFVAHGLGEFRNVSAKHYSEIMEMIKVWGLPVSPHLAVYADIDGVIEHAKIWETRRRELEYQTDGLVVKVDDLEQRARLGTRSKSPRWVIAYKYEAEEAITKIVGITIQVGKTGKLTPVAELEPVSLGGTVVKRASLHNPEELARKDVRIGDMVVIQKAGEIIPQVTRVETSARTGNEAAFSFPTVCPCGAAPVVRTPGEVDVRCGNPPSLCPGQMKEWMRWFAHRDAMDVEGLGEKLIEQLVDKSLARTLADLYRLEEKTLTGLERMGAKSARNLIAGLNTSKTRTLDRFLAGLAIRHVGTTTAEVLARKFGTLAALRSASLEVLAAVPDVGAVVAASVVNFFQDPLSNALVDDLLSVGVDPQPLAPLETRTEGLPLSGKTVVITGTLPKRTRPEAEALIKKLGGKVTGSVSKSTGMLLAGAEAGSKLDKARELKIPIIDEEELERLAATANGPAPDA